MSAAISTPAMRERPILFSAPMILPLLAGRKTVTRRIVNPQPSPDDHGGFWWPSHKARTMVAVNDMGCLGPFGSAPDRLWVKETFALSARDPGAFELDTKTPDHWDGVVYRATAPTQGDWEQTDENGARSMVPAPWKPSIFMPRWASRITLEITDVRVERLHDITADDARAEGTPVGVPVAARINGVSGHVAVYDPVRAFAFLWDAINGKRAAWATNPWVWRVAFRVLP